MTGERQLALLDRPVEIFWDEIDDDGNDKEAQVSTQKREPPGNRTPDWIGLLLAALGFTFSIAGAVLAVTLVSPWLALPAIVIGWVLPGVIAAWLGLI
jgi:hypothetical protein